ncbi:hypothetical protein N7E81_07215 [Reichenbachiella carrageenanivorans]|uniref:Sigma-70 family RNA polymerase sigma factor n=1 Tax=Reichenbachiella carrageenanivorans TaxID=2979869 RepID=A0ABY6D462_9BACT|nr:sigma-70 family RNA polymerase sigma factor [Reichenbachiella carrageenanivorans]UXX80888.1 hypothetical protein N7E81_07215 [Reichenbachiella carrageenanivorans]
MEKEKEVSFQNVNDEELFFYMACRDEDPTTADLAFNEFYSRFKNYTFSVCRDFFISRNRFDEEDLKSFFHNVFLKIYDKAGEISIDSSVPNDEKEFVILKIISRFVNYEGLTYLKSSKNSSLEISYTDDLLNDVPEEGLSEYQSIERKTLENALASLSDRNRFILLDFYRHENINSEKANWTPPQTLTEMCNYYDTTKQALRKIKERALKKIIEYVDQSEKLKVVK